MNKGARYVKIALMLALLAFFALPLVWLAVTPFSTRPSLSLSLPGVTVRNFSWAWSAGWSSNLRPFLSSMLLSFGSMILIVATGSLGAYGLSRSSFRGREAILYGLLLLSSIVTGVAAMVPIYWLVLKLRLVDTYLGVILVFAGGYLPTALFILKDFMDSVPRAYEEAALVDGSSPLQVFTNVAFPMARPGIAVIALLGFINAWSNFLVPFILFTSHATDKYPLAVAIFRFQDEMGILDLGKIASYSLAYAIPVIAVYFWISLKYGFGFFGGIKG
jgi:ABC-type glycerol-3-phosphate transport system permease component